MYCRREDSTLITNPIETNYIDSRPRFTTQPACLLFEIQQFVSVKLSFRKLSWTALIWNLNSTFQFNYPLVKFSREMEIVRSSKMAPSKRMIFQNSRFSFVFWTSCVVVPCVQLHILHNVNPGLPIMTNYNFMMYRVSADNLWKKIIQSRLAEFYI